MADDPFRNLVALHQKIDRHWAQVTSHQTLKCGRGCTVCCHTAFSVCRIEADFILAGIDRLSSRVPERGPLDDHTRFDELVSSPPCVFLTSGGDCAIYPVRPIICRSHGIPVTVEGQEDICPLNEAEEGVPVLNLELLNATLVAVDALYCRQTAQPSDRRTLNAIARVLDRTPSPG